MESQKSLGERVHDLVSDFVAKPRNWFLFVMVIASYPLLHVWMHPLEDVIPILDQVPTFRLDDDKGRFVGFWDDSAELKEINAQCVAAERKAYDQGPVGCESRRLTGEPKTACEACADRQKAFTANLNLKGYIWLAAPVCILGDCENFKEGLGDLLHKIQHRSRGMGKWFRIIALPQDARRVTVDEVADYGRDHRVSRNMWRFAAADPASVAAATDGIFQIPVPGTQEQGAALAARQHGVVALVDPGGFVRGYYEIATEEQRDRLARDMGLVGNRGF